MSAQLGSTRRRWPCLVPAAANSAVSSAVSVISAGNGQLNPPVVSRFNVNRTVDGATPTRRAISVSPTPAVLKRSTSRTWRIVVLSAGIRSPMQKAKGADPNRASRDAAEPGDIIPECRAKSSRDAERDQIGMVGDIIADSRATSPGIRNRLLSGELNDALKRLDADDAIVCIVITGAGDRAFSAGGDIHEQREDDRRLTREELDARRGRGSYEIAASAKPTIGMINGLAYGGAAVLASSLDMRVGCEGTRFRFLAAAYGRINSTWTLPNQVGWPIAKELLFTAR